MCSKWSQNVNIKMCSPRDDDQVRRKRIGDRWLGLSVEHVTAEADGMVRTADQRCVWMAFGGTCVLRSPRHILF